MRMKEIFDKNSKASSKLYEVVDISRDTIKVPSKNFKKFVRENEGYSFINSFTMDAYVSQIANLYEEK